MRNFFIYDGKNCCDFGVYISGQGTFDSPVRELSMISVDGRDGDLIGSGTRFQNRDLKYPAFIYKNFGANIAALRAFLLSGTGYRKLIDTYHPDEYRMAAYRGALTPDVTRRNDAGKFDIVFNVKPQRYLVTGEAEIELLTSGSIVSGTMVNPSLFASKPLIRVYGTGTLYVGDSSVVISAADEYTDIDCELMEAYKGLVNCNNNIELSDVDFPTLAHGVNNIRGEGGITRVIIKPRWWTV